MTGVAPEIAVVRHPRARRAKLSVDPMSGAVRLTLPPRAALAPALAWARGQTAWIERQRAVMPEARPFAPGATIPFDGGTLTIHWAPDAGRGVRRDSDLLILGGALETVSRRVETWLRREALALLSADTGHYAARAGVMVSRVAVGDPRGRWGSCASSGVIRYSWRLIMAPPEVRRATAAHEVAHRVHMDHSPRFHALVASLFGRDPTPERQWLRTHGASLHWFGRAGAGAGVGRD